MFSFRARGSFMSFRSMALLLFMAAGSFRITTSFQLQRTGRFSATATRQSPLYTSQEVSNNESSAVKVETLLQDAQRLEFSMQDHRPLGCTVEESLGKQYGPMVFCSKVTPGGFAAQAGIQPGDVFLGVSDMFGGIEDVTQVGIERVKGLVGACPDDEPLVIQVARGTAVMADHEETIVDLCSNPDKSDSEVDECVTDFLRAGYYTEDAAPADDAATDAPDEAAADDNDLLDDMFNMWAEDLPSTPSKPSVDTSATDAEKPKPKPWSSRSSPSGTFVRDPRTGKMTNIDA